MYAFIQTVYIMYGVSEMYTSLFYNTHTIVVHIRVSFSAEISSHCIPWFNLVHNLSTLQIIFPVHSSLDSGSKFPFAIWKFPEVSVLTRPLPPGTILQESDLCRVVTDAKV